MLVEVIVDTCLNLREEPVDSSTIVGCLPHGAVAEVVPTDAYVYYSRWIHLVTDDGLEGWVPALHVSWHSDGVRLEE